MCAVCACVCLCINILTIDNELDFPPQFDRDINAFCNACSRQFQRNSIQTVTYVRLMCAGSKNRDKSSFVCVECESISKKRQKCGTHRRFGIVIFASYMLSIRENCITTKQSEKFTRLINCNASECVCMRLEPSFCC